MIDEMSFEDEDEEQIFLEESMISFHPNEKLEM